MVKKIVLWILLIGCMVLIFHFSAQPADDSMELSDGLLNKILAFLNIKLPEYVVIFMRVFIRKVAHFAIYALLGVLAYLLLKLGYSVENKLAFPCALMVSAFYAATDEIHQLFVPGRSGSVKDVFLDGVGALCGIILAWGMCRILLGRKKNG